MKLEVEATGVTDGLPLRVASPQRGGVGPAVGADHPVWQARGGRAASGGRVG